MLALHHLSFQVISLSQKNFQHLNKIMRLLLELGCNPIILSIWCKVVRIDTVYKASLLLVFMF